MEGIFTDEMKKTIEDGAVAVLANPREGTLSLMSILELLRRAVRFSGDRAGNLAYGGDKEHHQAMLEQAAWAAVLVADIEKSGLELPALGELAALLLSMLEHRRTFGLSQFHPDMSEFIPVPDTIPGVESEDFAELVRLLESKWDHEDEELFETSGTLEGPIPRVVVRIAEGLLAYMDKLEKKVATDEGMSAFEDAADGGLFNYRGMCKMIVACKKRKGPEFQWPDMDEGIEQADKFFAGVNKSIEVADVMLKNMGEKSADKA